MPEFDANNAPLGLKVTPKTKIYIESLENLKITNTFEEIYDNSLNTTQYQFHIVKY